MTRASNDRTLPGWIGSVAVTFSVAAAWESLSRSGAVPTKYFPPVTVILGEWVSLLKESSFWSQVGSTVIAWMLGLAISVVVGVAVGTLMGSSERLHRLVRVVVELLRPVPPVVLIPIALLTLGISLSMSVVVIAQGAVWPILVQSFYGVRSLEPVALDTARSFRLPRRYELVFVRVPGALPFIVTGLRLSASIALIVAIVSELVGGAEGLGSGVLLAQASGNMVQMYALIFTTGLMGVTVSYGLKALERRVLFWAPGFRAQVAG